MERCYFPFVHLESRVFDEWRHDLPESIKHNLFLVVRCKMGKHAWILNLVELSTGEHIGCDSDDLVPACREAIYTALGYHGYPRLSP